MRVDDVVVVATSCRLGRVPGRFLGERLEVRLHGGDLGHRLEDRALDLLGDLVRLLEREVARQLEVERELGAGADGEHAHVVHLAHARNAERSRVRALAHGGVVAVGSTWTTTSASGSADCTARSTASAAA